MRTLQLDDEDVAAIDTIVNTLSHRYSSVEDPDFQRAARMYAEELPRRIRTALNTFRTLEPSGGLVVRGLPVDDANIGPTPEHWKNKPVPSPTLRQDIAFYLLANLLGEPIAWATQQDGYIMHDVFPIKGHEREQIGFGSEELLTWHTEDAYHPLRTDYLGLMCLRNHERVETTMCDIEDVEIDDATREVLSQERFLIVPDHAHRMGDNNLGTGEDTRTMALRERSYRQVESALRDPEPVAVLFGAPDSPYLRLDPEFMPEHTGVEKRALDTIRAAIDNAMSGVVLEPGDIIFIDNYRVVHGRKPFKARFDGTDRWLRRLNVTRDLRKSRANRLDAGSRVIY